MSTWQEDIARTARYAEPYYRNAKTPYLCSLRDTDDYVVEWIHPDLGSDVSTPQQRLVMRAKVCTLDDARDYIKRMNARLGLNNESEEW